MSTKTIKTAEALAALNVLTQVGFAKRPALERLMAAELGRPVTDQQFETVMSQLGRRIIRVRGAGGGIRLF